MNKDYIRYYWRKIKELFLIKNEIKDDQNYYISYINWWGVSHNKTYTFDSRWFTRFIEHNIRDNKKYIKFYSMYGPRRFLESNGDFVKIFFSAENLTPHKKYDSLLEEKNFSDLAYERYKDYSDYAINDVDISLGYIELNAKNYIRFPAWILYMFSPTDEYKDIKRKIYDLNTRKITSNRLNMAVIINSHDGWGTRSKICNELKSVLEIKYAGKWRNNTNELWNKYANNKLKYIEQFKFNICAENIDAPQYVTEKLFESICAGNIPIYHGAFNNPEADIILKNSIIFWHYNDNNKENLKLVNRLLNDDDFYFKFINQKKFTELAPEIIYKKITELKDRINLLLK